MSGYATCACVERERMGTAPSEPDTCAVIVAGGSGERFGDPRGKQFVDLLGLPLMCWSILAFDSAPSVGHLVVVCPEGRADEVAKVALGAIETKREVTLVPGGATRQDSVLAGLTAAPPNLAYVAIHDGARPLIEVAAIERCLTELRARDVDGTICAARVSDTLKLVDEDGNIVGTPDRSWLWGAQTPQCFALETVRSAHERALLEGRVATDDSELVCAAGGRVAVVACSRDNLKVTMPEDLGIAEALLRSRMGIA